MKTAENKSYLNGTLAAHDFVVEINGLEGFVNSGSPTQPQAIFDDENRKIEITDATFIEQNMSDTSGHYEDTNPHEWEGGGMEDLSAKELLKLPLEKRRRILKKKTEDIEEEYEEGGDLRRFQALEKDDFYASP